MSARFWDRVDIHVDGCWLWKLIPGSHGYGVFLTDEGRSVPAHRFSYLTMVGDVEDGLHLDHLCRNRICVRPDHLEPVTPAENARRAVQARMGWLDEYARCPRGHLLSPDNYYKRPTGSGGMCKVCAGKRQVQRRRAAGAAPKRVKLNEHRATEIRSLFLSGVPIEEVAAIFDVHPVHAKRVAKATHWVGDERSPYITGVYA